MVRLATAFVIALLVHSAVLLITPPWPLRQAPRLAHRQVLTMQLVARQPYRPPAMSPLPKPPSPLPPEPKPAPKQPVVPKPVAKPKLTRKEPPKIKPKPKPVQKPAPVPATQPPPTPEPLPTPDPGPVPAPIESRPEASDQDAMIEPSAFSAPDKPPPATATASDAAATVVRARPRYSDNPPPPYPSIARKRRYQGTVVLEVFVTEDGRVGDLRIVESSKYSLLDRAAMKAVRRWQFEPAQQGDRKIAMWVSVPIRFLLE